MKLTTRFLNSKGACKEGLEWFKAQKETNIIKVLRKLALENHWPWASWLIVRVMTRPQYLAYAIFAAEQVIEIFEKKYPKDKRPRKAIEAAKAFLKNDTHKNRVAAGAAAGAAADAAADAYSDADAADAYSDADAADAADAAYDAAAALRTKILEYGISLIKTEGK